MFIKKFRILFIVCFLSLIVSYFLFTRLKIRTDLDFIINDYLKDTSTSFHDTHDQCLQDECTNEQSQKHGDLFASFRPDWSGCFSDFYLTAFDNHQIPVEVVIDVGANKAYTVATWLAFFLPELGINQGRLGQYIQSTKGLSESCGSCNDCQDEPFKRKKIQQKVKLQIHAFEPQPGTVDILKDIQRWMNVSGKSDSIFEIHSMAVSEYVL
jgi:hypothetical protein